MQSNNCGSSSFIKNLFRKSLLISDTKRNSQITSRTYHQERINRECSSNNFVIVNWIFSVEVVRRAYNLSQLVENFELLKPSSRVKKDLFFNGFHSLLTRLPLYLIKHWLKITNSIFKLLVILGKFSFFEAFEMFHLNKTNTTGRFLKCCNKSYCAQYTKKLVPNQYFINLIPENLRERSDD